MLQQPHGYAHTLRPFRPRRRKNNFLYLLPFQKQKFRSRNCGLFLYRFLCVFDAFLMRFFTVFLRFLRIFFSFLPCAPPGSKAPEHIQKRRKIFPVFTPPLQKQKFRSRNRGILISLFYVFYALFHDRLNSTCAYLRHFSSSSPSTATVFRSVCSTPSNGNFIPIASYFVRQRL